MAKGLQQKILRRADYEPYPYEIENLDLKFKLHPTETQVKSKLKVTANPKSGKGPGAPMVLDGEDLKLKSIKIDGRTLADSEYSIGDDKLTIHNPPKVDFELEIENEIDPSANTKLSGLYMSDDIYVTQCEAEGFRRITFFPDRPDVMTTYDVTIDAEKGKFPHLLSNGNETGTYEYTDGDGTRRHVASFNDPFKKPSYLFALVGSDHEFIEDTYTTKSGRDVRLRIYCPQGDSHKVEFAMEALKHSMKWDEEAYGREYDLDVFSIVAVSNFNAGAMENKSLNIFNASAVYADADTADDHDFQWVEGVVGHEYFHNWSGDRVTVRDWFELSLKEGFTVRRDHEFSEAMFGEGPQRIDQVQALRYAQFREDAGTQSHPVRPSETQSIDNFYTGTIYEKGNELIRMMKTIIGDDAYRKGTDLYFDRHDGEAVTIDEFVQAMQDASGYDMTHFKKWYSQSGTPEVTAKGAYDAATETYRLELSQITRPTADQTHKEALVIPVKMGLIGDDGKDMKLTLKGEDPATPGHGDTDRVIILDQDKQVFEFTGVKSKPVPSLFRGFSAPIKLESDVTNTDLVFQMAHDSDGFNRFEAAETLKSRILLGMVEDYQNGKPVKLDKGFIEAAREILLDQNVDKTLAAKSIAMPAAGMLMQKMKVQDPDAAVAVTKEAAKQLAAELKTELEDTYLSHKDSPLGEYKPVPAEFARRALSNTALSLLTARASGSAQKHAHDQYNAADNMTDRMAALRSLMKMDEKAPGLKSGYAQKALDAFYNKYKNDKLVVNQWFRLQATHGTARDVEKLTQHKDFDWTYADRIRSVFGGFIGANPEQFHKKDGSGYDLVADAIIKLDETNDHLSAGLAKSGFTMWRSFDKDRQDLMKGELQRILDERGDKISNMLRDIVTNALKPQPGEKPSATAKAKPNTP